MRFEWIVAWRFLREGGLQTGLIMVGAALGISFIVFITGFLGELQRDIVQRTLGVQPHVTVKPLEEVAQPLRPRCPRRSCLYHTRNAAPAAARSRPSPLHIIGAGRIGSTESAGLRRRRCR